MKSSSLQGKTVRPGLMAYSFYRSDRHPYSRRAPARPRRRIPYKSLFMSALVIGAVAFICIIAAQAYQSFQDNSTDNPAALAVADGPKQCAGNSLDKLVIVSVGERHMWVCVRHKVVYDSPVVTGQEAYAATLTPRGTYRITSKQTETKLTGADAAGSWNVHVHYWMPFLHNKHGIYGFHDATWRPANAFGNISPHSKQASHGCVELPLNASNWLYNWASVGTTVTIKD